MFDFLRTRLASLRGEDLGCDAPQHLAVARATAGDGEAISTPAEVAKDDASGGGLLDSLAALGSMAATDPVVAALFELAAVAGQLARLDESLVKAGKGESDEQSREMLADKKLRILQKIRESALVKATNWTGERSKPQQRLAVAMGPTQALQQEPPDTERPGGTMKGGLAALRGHDPACVLIVRKIKKLGFDAPSHLKRYLSQYGAVDEVYVANSWTKRCSRRPAGRVRPAALGFAVMGSGLAAQAVLAAEAHAVNGIEIEVQQFEPFGGDDSPGSELSF